MFWIKIFSSILVLGVLSKITAYDDFEDLEDVKDDYFDYYKDYDNGRTTATSKEEKMMIETGTLRSKEIREVRGTLHQLPSGLVAENPFTPYTTLADNFSNFDEFTSSIPYSYNTHISTYNETKMTALYTTSIYFTKLLNTSYRRKRIVKNINYEKITPTRTPKSLKKVSKEKQKGTSIDEEIVDIEDYLPGADDSVPFFRRVLQTGTTMIPITTAQPSPKTTTQPETMTQPKTITQSESISQAEKITQPQTTIQSESITQPEITTQPQTTTQQKTTTQYKITTQPETTISAMTPAESNTSTKPSTSDDQYDSSGPIKHSTFSVTNSEDTSTMTTTTKSPKSSKHPELDIPRLLEIIADLASEFETNLTRKLNETFVNMSIPTCSIPTTEPPVTSEYDSNYTGATIAKCFVCGLDMPGIPEQAHCADAFAGDFLPLVPVDPTAKGKISKFRKYCKYSNIPGYKLNQTHPRHIYGRWTGGCAVRWIDLSGVYTQRTCRNRLQPTMGKHYASKRMAKLEKSLWNIENGCIVSPMATLVPLSRAVSLYARFHACVCTGSWCNTAFTNTQRMWNFVILIISIGIT